MPSLASLARILVLAGCLVRAAFAADATALPLMTTFPKNGAADVCPDTPLRLTFPTPVSVGQGRIQIINTATNAVLEEIDVAAPFATQPIGGEPGYRYLPVIVSGNEVAIYPRHDSLAHGTSCAVTVDAGAFVARDTPLAAVEKGQWTFSTRQAAPRPEAARVVVAADGTGDFCTLQGALDFIPDGNTTPRTIFVKRGTYNEIVFFTNKHAITIQGEDRRETVLQYATNDRFNPTRGNPFGTSAPNPAATRTGGSIYHRGVFLGHRVNDLVLTTLTIRNTTPQGGSQAEAIILNGTTEARAILKDLDLYSFQDTLQVNGQAFITGCHIEGDVDFLWGTGPCFIENTTARSLRSDAYYTQIRNPATNHGYVFVKCVFEGASGVTGNLLSRIELTRFPHSEVVLIDCTLTSAVSPVAWQYQRARDGSVGDPAEIHFWEYNSRDPQGNLVDTTQRLAGSRRLKDPADKEIVARYRDPGYVLGNDWNPRSAPVFRR